MAYPYYPNYYNYSNYGNYGTPYYQQAQPLQSQPLQSQPIQQQSQQSQRPTIQQSGFVLVQSEQEAMAYPVAPGNSITFKDEHLPYCYVKTMGFNQLDRPTFEKYRLVKENSTKEDSTSEGAEPRRSENSGSTDVGVTYALKTDLAAIWREIDALRENISDISKEKEKAQADKKTIRVKKPEVTEDD
mgnify:CR=1 FL=1